MLTRVNIVSLFSPTFLEGETQASRLDKADQIFETDLTAREIVRTNNEVSHFRGNKQNELTVRWICSKWSSNLDSDELKYI